MVFLRMDEVQAAGCANVRKLCIIPFLNARCCGHVFFFPLCHCGPDPQSIRAKPNVQ